MRIGDKLRGTVTGIQSYGAFVELENGITGLVHISEIKTGYVENIREQLKIGQELLVQVVDFDEYSHKVSLSLRTLEEEKQKVPRPHRFTSDRYKIGFEPLAKSLPHWIKEAKRYLERQS
ncbi:RNA-binding protein [Streptococcus azizii]|uniref:RNA-binding protein n=1 Tax=Streptococcus azizii TaxID=1579424 RepID=A0AB36JSE5_9STRE|nr:MULTISPECIES: S1 RNA-binding domain-containing protein [Streptococcus]MBF0775365.1 S1 RNA-binding domain-containing protein [Streptococcus sp. 19428wD3_AN2]ONK29634.1 RNA-binding protein [Streptococcus azizii]ONK30142.1 RNA-binding protein [Streptococcus azizii]ONK30918.1 RNA-binding protein [Streptococcus azizii]TFU84888.1 S1 RNA-binding domain-containing protein [Streptococcus sp. AN2]